MYYHQECTNLGLPGIVSVNYDCISFGALVDPEPSVETFKEDQTTPGSIA